MKKSFKRIFSILMMILFASAIFFEYSAYARAGGGRSSGSSGSRSYSSPRRAPSESVQKQAPAQQPAGGGFMRSLGGGILGGLMGGMIFSSLFGMGGHGGGGGFGILEFILIAAAGYFIYTRFIRKKKDPEQNQAQSYQQTQFQPQGADISVDEGIAQIRRSDSSFDENRFNDTVMDIFFKIQGAWANRDLTSADYLLTDEMKGIFQQDIDELLREKKINKLDNIAVRKVEIVEAWQENGFDYIKAVFTANLLDYTTDEAGNIVSGSKTNPVKFEECWTFTRVSGNRQWKLSAISQM